MIRENRPIPGDSSHDEMILVMQSSGERDMYQRVFPNPIPDTHELFAEWDPTNMQVRVGVRPRLVAEVAGRAEILSRRLTTAVDGVRKELEKLSKADLETRAAELGIADKIPGSATKAQMVAEIVKRMDEEGLLERQAGDDEA